MDRTRQRCSRVSGSSYTGAEQRNVVELLEEKKKHLI